ncbi:MAG TPA: EamA family transporter [Gemmatimonadales bacterium]|nr:EamA family transporter [Gemmatimonadales bacterium]
MPTLEYPVVAPIPDAANLATARHSEAQPSLRLRVLVWLALCTIWGSTWLGIKLGLRDLPPLSFAGLRFALAALLLGALVAGRRLPLPKAGADWRLLLYTGFLSITLNYALVFWGEQYIASGLAALLSATVPLFGLPLAHRYLAAEPLTWRKFGGVLLGLAGTAVVFSGELGTSGTHALWASAGIVVAALATAHAGVLVKARATHIEPSVLAGVQMAGGCIPLLLGGVLLEGSPLEFRWTPLAFGALAYLTLLGSVVAFLMYYWLIRHTALSGVLMIPLITPLVAVLVGVVFGGEAVSWHTAVGGTAIIGGVALAVVRRERVGPKTGNREPGR